MKLYIVTISGEKSYFFASLPSSLIHTIDDHCTAISRSKHISNPDQALSALLEFICVDLKYNFDQIDIEHIFRINL